MNNQTSLSTKELQELKSFTVAWLKTYNFMPPEFILELYIFLRRLTYQLEEQLRQVVKISVAQSYTVSTYSNQLQNIAMQSRQSMLQ